MKITHEERFTEVELGTMFNVDCDPSCKVRHNLRVRWNDEPYAMNDTKVPLLVVRKAKKVSKRVRRYCDSVKPGVTTHKPGTKGRVADMVKWYAEHAANEESAFEV